MRSKQTASREIGDLGELYGLYQGFRPFLADLLSNQFMAVECASTAGLRKAIHFDVYRTIAAGMLAVLAILLLSSRPLAI